ncbi:MAG: 1-acyl-sn-glycerol-3-phosphate acyltransferase [Bacteroidetes bacterium]|nr:1-acyl-sn-glycerol-3-phosphate acyltransferase [Bacteroidota bacterium]
MIRKFFQIVFTIYAFTVFILLMLIALPFVVVASFFGKETGGNMIYNICRLWSDIALFSWGIFHRNIYEAPVVTDHPVVYVFNHTSYIDIPFLLKAIRKHPIRVLGKIEMSKIPIFGYIYRKAVVMVDRNSEEARLRSVKQLKKVLSKNISIVIAPEGTFNMTSKPLSGFYNGAFKIAVETNTAIQPVLLLDAYDRLHYKSIFTLTPGRSRAVFLPEIMPGNDAAYLKQEVFNRMSEALLRYKAGWIKDEHDNRK